MAHDSIVTGGINEKLAEIALMRNGWAVATPTVPEPFDLVARDPQTGQWRQIQVKTARVRSDRNGEIVVIAKKGNGKPYTRDEVDLFIGVLGHKVFLFENREIAEYWVTPDTISWKWRELPLV